MNRSFSSPLVEQRPTWLWLAVALAVTIGIYLLAYHGILWTSGHVYQNWDQTFPPLANEIRAYGNISGSTWGHVFELGSPGPLNGLNLYFDLIVRHGLAWLGGGVLARWLNLVYSLVGAAGFWVLARRMGLSGFSSLVVCVISQFNPRTFSLALSGHTESGYAYALAPWIIALADAATRAEKIRGFITAGLGAGLVLALACSSTFGITLVGPLLAGYAVAAALRRPGRVAVLLAMLGAIVMVLHLHWILPTAAGTTSSNLFRYNQPISEIQADYVHKYREYSVPPRQAMIGHTDNLGMGTEYAYPVEPPKDAWWKPSAYALLGLALLGLLCRVPNPALKWFAALSLLFGFVMLTGAKTLAGAYLYEVILAQVKVLFFFMARPTRWLLVYYTGFAILAGLGLETVRRRTFWVGRCWPDFLVSSLVLASLAVYLWPWWSGQLTKPKNETTQTMALMPQLLRAEEEQLATALAKDPGMYRITVFPTISSPTGNIPAPPSSSLTRNFGMMGKDSLVGPAFIGNPYGRFLLSLAHRRSPYTDEYGRLLGLGAVRRVIWDTDQPYLSYMDFGWMPATKRGSETLPDPRGVLRPFLEAQGDLTPDPDWSFGPFTTLNNRDYLPRLRAVTSASLAAGGLPLLASMSQLETNPFEHVATFFSTDVDDKGIERLGRARDGLFIHNDAWPELLLPYLQSDRWVPALPPGKAAPEGWSGLTDRWHQILWFEGSPLNARALWSQAQAQLEIALPGAGPHRVFVREASLPGQHGLDVSLGDRVLGSTASADPFDRGWRWLDLGIHVLTTGQPLQLAARGRGAVVSGVLAVPEGEFNTAMAALNRSFPQATSREVVLAEAEACTEVNSGVYSLVRDIPLLASLPGVSLTTTNLRAENVEGSGVGSLVAEGEKAGQAVFRLDFPQPVSGFTLVSYPRLFGDIKSQSFAQAQWSSDGQHFEPLYQVHGATDGKWEDVYGRREEVSVQAKLSSLWLRFDLCQAQLVSLGNPPNQPMTVSVTPAEPYPGAPSMGQAVVLPARFAPRAFRPGPHRARARMLTREGPRWVDLGIFEPDGQGRVRLDIDGPAGAACDLLEVSSLVKPSEPVPAPGLEADRISSARYQCQGQLPASGLLLFSEAFHPSWQARYDGKTLAPLKAYGFMNAYPLPESPPDKLLLEFTPEQYRDLGLTISLAGWAAFLLALVALWFWPGEKKHPR